MSPTYKKGLLIAGLVLVTLIIGWLLWYVFFAPALQPTTPLPEDTGTPTSTPDLPSAGGATGDTPPTGGAAGSGGLPPTGQRDTGTQPPTPPTAVTPGATPRTTPITQLTNTTADYPHLSGSGARYYDRATGSFVRITGDGDQVRLTDDRFFNVETVTWSNDGDRAILEYPDGANVLYDFSTKKQVTLPAHWQEFDFSPQADQIATKSIGLNRDSRWLVVANSDGSGAQLIEPLGDNGEQVDISWSPNNLSIATFTDSIDFDRQNLYFVGKNGENFKSTIIEGRGFEHQWNPSGSSILYSVYNAENDLKPRLWTVSAQGETIGQNRQDLGIETWAHKCAFSSETVAYCAVPNTLPEGAGMFPAMAETTIDSIYRVNLATGSATLAAQPEEAVSIHTIVVDEAGDNIYFTTYNTSGVYHIDL